MAWHVIFDIEFRELLHNLAFSALCKIVVLR